MQNKKGFTIIELIVVITIIAALSAIVTVNVVQYIQKAKNAALASNMHSISTLTASYADRNGGYDGFCASPEFEKITSAMQSAYPGYPPIECYDSSTVGGDGQEMYCAQNELHPDRWVAALYGPHYSTVLICTDSTTPGALYWNRGYDAQCICAP